MSQKADVRAEVRRGRYKVAVDAEEGRRRREDSMVKIRRSKREEGLLKKRREGMQGLTLPMSKLASSTEMKLTALPSMVSGLRSNDVRLQLKATMLFRKLLSSDRNPPIAPVIQSGVVPRFVEFLTREDCPELQFEAAWALTNIASGTPEDAKVVIDNGAIPIFVRLLSSPNEDVREQTAWALGNVAGDSPENRDVVLGYGAVTALLSQLNENSRPGMIRNTTWALSTLCRGKPQPSSETTNAILSALERLIHSDDEEVLTNACWALYFLSDGNREQIQAVIETGVCPRLVGLLLHPSPSLLIPALKTVGNIVSEDDFQTQYMIDCQALPSLLSLLKHTRNKDIKREVCWTISNITAGTTEQIQAVIDADIIPYLVHLLQTDDFGVKREAAWAIAFVASGGTPEQIKYLVREGCIKPVCGLLSCPDKDLVRVCLQFLGHILSVGKAERDVGSSGGANAFAQMIEDSEGLEKIENLQSDDNPLIYEKSVELLEKYWQDDDGHDHMDTEK
ncbi:unnamed protein product [Spirodela intermedia]|uniref:Importin subunit alpha n=1 Tax=Spirodela intermedia TaxID=51605 RepID=A0A7I8KN30_SPIIN|nr:unnamed protein product [Spirodela intermedia]